MNADFLLTGRNEAMLLEALRTKGTLDYETIYGFYATHTNGRGFINKVIMLGIARLSKTPNRIEYIPLDERK